MPRSIWPTLVLGLATLFPCASAGFGFTNANFDYVQLSSPQVISWNGQTGEIALRLMVYPSNTELSYVPIAANLSGNSYTWVPTSVAPGSRWTLEGIDEEGDIAASQNYLTIQGTMAADGVTASLMQQNPQSTAQPTTLSATTTAQPTATAEAPSTNSPIPPTHKSMPTDNKNAILVGVIVGIAGILSLATFFVLRHRQKRGRSLAWNPFRSKKQSRAMPPPYELQDNDSMETLPKPMELQGSRVGGTSETSWGNRMELGLGGASRQSVGKRISLASGAVETSMGKRMELG